MTFITIFFLSALSSTPGSRATITRYSAPIVEGALRQRVNLSSRGVVRREHMAQVMHDVDDSTVFVETLPHDACVWMTGATSHAVRWRSAAWWQTSLVLYGQTNASQRVASRLLFCGRITAPPSISAQSRCVCRGFGTGTGDQPCAEFIRAWRATYRVRTQYTLSKWYWRRWSARTKLHGFLQLEDAAGSVG